MLSLQIAIRSDGLSPRAFEDYEAQISVYSCVHNAHINTQNTRQIVLTAITRAGLDNDPTEGLANITPPPQYSGVVT